MMVNHYISAIVIIVILLIGLIRWVINECARPSDHEAFKAIKKNNRITTFSLVSVVLILSGANYILFA